MYTITASISDSNSNTVQQHPQEYEMQKNETIVSHFAKITINETEKYLLNAIRETEEKKIINLKMNLFIFYGIWL